MIQFLLLMPVFTLIALLVLIHTQTKTLNDFTEEDK